MGSVVNEASNVVLWHLGQLLLEDTLETTQDDHGLPLVVVVDYPEFDLAISFFNDTKLQRFDISKTGLLPIVGRSRDSRALADLLQS